MLTATDIRVTLGRAPVLHGIDLDAAPGQLTAIVGPNGSGKTTLLRAITGDVAYNGRIDINGTDIATLRPWQLAQMRGVLPQASALAFPFTVIEVVAIGLHRGGAADTAQTAMAALSRVGLSTHADRYYQELSGGEQQRVQLARVLAQVWQPVVAGAPRWLLLDEPVSALDIAHQVQVMDIARDFAQRGGGVVAVMHDLNLTALYADRISVLSAGRCVASGPPAQVMTDAILSDAYGCALFVGRTPSPGVPFVLPHRASAPTPSPS